MDMTPMIDIVFQLLIFFLMAAQMVRLSRADVQLPREPGEQSKVAQKAGMIVNLLASGELVVGDRPVALDELEDLLRELSSAGGDQGKVTIRADHRANSEQLNKVIERLHRQGIAVARIATAPPR